MYSAISGLRANQEKLDIIGNNIANVSTTAFKSQSVRFEDMVSQTSSQATASNTNTGGVNGKQIGLGVQIASIDSLNTNGSMQPTSRPLDAAIDGAGYFVVGSGSVPASNAAVNKMTLSYTRDGGFELDDKGNLTTSDGLRVMGYTVNTGTGTKDSIAYSATTDPTINYVDANSASLVASTNLVPLVIPDSVNIPEVIYAAGPPVVNAVPATTSKVLSFSIEKDGVIKAVLANDTTTVIGQIGMASFKNEGGLKKLGKDQYQSTANSGAAVLRTGLGTAAANDNSNGYGDINQGMLEMSNVDLAQQFTDMIVASRAFQANGKVITTGDDILNELIGLKR